MSYLNEGVKIYFRVSYGVCYMLKDDILSNIDKNLMSNYINEKTRNFNIISSHQLLRISYTLTLTEMEKSFLTKEVKHHQLKVFSSII